MDRKFYCSECGKCYYNKNGLKYHFSKGKCSIATKNRVKQYVFSCADCEKKFFQKKYLQYHFKNGFCPASVEKRKEYCCNDCGKSYSHQNGLKYHKSNGKCERTSVTYHFDSENEFLVWKDDEEQRTNAKYSQTRSEWKTKKQSVKRNYVCHRSGYVRIQKNTSLRKRALKRKGSCKIDNHCTAFMLYEKLSNGTVTVRYNKQHCNHDLEMKYLPLSASVKNELAGKLADGVPMDRILDDIQETIHNSRSLTRTHLITKHELHNIKSEFNISFHERLSNEDTVSVELLIDEYRKKYGTQTPFRYYKQQGVLDEEFSKEDVLLVIMDPTQMNYLKKFGVDKICVDSTHCTTSYDFILNTVLVVDDFNMGVPVAHLISNRENEVFLEKFFEVIKNDCGVINTKIFMSDDFPAYINAWKKVMGPPENCLLCIWHIDRNWRKKLPLVKDVRSGKSTKELQKQVYKAVRTVMEETDDTLFPQIVYSLIQKLESDPSTKEFGSYFKKEYSERYRMWAFAFRKHLGINTNMKLEALHRELKTVHFKGLKNKRMDKLVVTLLKMNRDKAVKRMSQLVMESDTYTLLKIRVRHAEGMKIPIEDIVAVSNEIAVVKSQSYRSITYTVQKNADECNCRLRCHECESICVHQYMCSCSDNSISSNLCKHIHAVNNFRISQNETNLDVLLDVDSNYELEEITTIYNQMQSQSMENLQSEKDMRETMSSLAHEVLQGIETVQLDAEDELDRKALNYLKQTAKLLAMKQKRLTTLEKDKIAEQ